MLAGDLYLATDPQLVAERLACRRLLKRLNDSEPVDPADASAVGDRLALLRALLGNVGDGAWIEPPFHCDYGQNIQVGARFYANFQCIVLDCAKVTIGDDVFFAPGVHVYTATHPIDAATRVAGPELAKPVTIGDRVWLGGGTIVLPGVTIGSGTVVGAGSVVTRSLPDNVVAAGNPCVVRRQLMPGESPAAAPAGAPGETAGPAGAGVVVADT